MLVYFIYVSLSRWIGFYQQREFILTMEGKLSQYVLMDRLTYASACTQSVAKRTLIYQNICINFMTWGKNSGSFTELKLPESSQCWNVSFECIFYFLPLTHFSHWTLVILEHCLQGVSQTILTIFVCFKNPVLILLVSFAELLNYKDINKPVMFVKKWGRPNAKTHI